MMPRTTKNLLTATALTVAAATGMAGCASSTAPTSASTAAPSSSGTSKVNANVGLTGPQLQAAFKAAAAKANAVHVVGAFNESGTPYALDLNLNKNGATSGSISQNGASIPLRVVNNVTYIQLTPEFLKQEAKSDPSLTPGVISLIQNKWVSSQSAMGQQLSADFDGLINYDSFMKTIENGASPSPSASGSSSASGMPSMSSMSSSASSSASASPSTSSSPAVSLADLTADGTATYNGKTVAVYKSPNGSIAYFDASGPAYLDKVISKGADAGTITFTWNKPVTVVAPQPSEIFST